MHALNTLFALLELLGTNAPPAPWAALPLTLVLLAAYLGVAYITKATQGFYRESSLPLPPTAPHLRASAPPRLRTPR